MDQFFIFLFRQTYAIQLYPPAVITDHSTAGVPFHEDAMFIVSLGYVVSLLLCMPLGFLNLVTVAYGEACRLIPPKGRKHILSVPLFWGIGWITR